MDVNGTVSSSLLKWCKEVDSHFHGQKGVPRDVYNTVKEEMNALHRVDASKPSATSLAHLQHH